MTAETADTEPADAVTIVLPLETAVSWPVLATVATAGLLEVQLTGAVNVLPPESRTVAESCAVAPRASSVTAVEESKIEAGAAF